MGLYGSACEGFVRALAFPHSELVGWGSRPPVRWGLNLLAETGADKTALKATGQSGSAGLLGSKAIRLVLTPPLSIVLPRAR